MVSALASAAGPSQPLFGLTLLEFDQHVANAGRAEGLAKLRISPHCFRHGGASTDYVLKVRDLSDVQRHGRWLSTTSVRRYKKTGRQARQSGKITRSQVTMAARASVAFPTPHTARHTAGRTTGLATETTHERHDDARGDNTQTGGRRETEEHMTGAQQATPVANDSARQDEDEDTMNRNHSDTEKDITTNSRNHDQQTKTDFHMWTLNARKKSHRNAEYVHRKSHGCKLQMELGGTAGDGHNGDQR